MPNRNRPFSGFRHDLDVLAGFDGVISLKVVGDYATRVPLAHFHPLRRPALSARFLVFK